MITDEQINEVVTNKFNKVKTVSAVVLTSLLFMVGVGTAIAESTGSY
jgi:hypothetical protein